MKSSKVFIAYNVELGRVFKIEYGLPKNPENYNWICKTCKKPVYYNQYENCFKHRGIKPDGFDPETVEHKTMKKFFYDVFSHFNPLTKKQQEYRFGDQIADVYFELDDGKKVAIECQNSPITSQRLIERTRKYTAKNIYVLWVFNGLGTYVSEEKQPHNMDKVRVLKEEKRVHNLYKGRIYYMNVRGQEIVERPYPLHFSPYFENKKLETSIYGHDKYYKEFQSATVGNISSFKIICVEYNGYKLARFMDTNVSSSCIQQIIECLRKICLKRINEGSLDKTCEVKITVNSIIDLVKVEFGYFLPYLILKRLKAKIKRVRFERLLDENYNIQDTIVVRTYDYVK